MWSTEARVSKTDTARWLNNARDEWGYLNVIAIQGAERHAWGAGSTVVFVGPSMLRALLPSDESLSSALATALNGPVRALPLAGEVMTYEEQAAIVDKFGSHFTGWFVVSVNRHAMARNLQARDGYKRHSGSSVRFSSAILIEERSLAGLPVPFTWGIPLLDYPNFYLTPLGGLKPELWRPVRYQAVLPRVRTRSLTADEVLEWLPVPVAGAAERNFQLLGRIATRLRANGQARLVIVECPFADEVMPELQTTLWRAQKAEFLRQREAWTREQGVLWMDVTQEIKLQPEDFSDPTHIGSPNVRLRFAEAVGKRLAQEKP